MTTAVARPLAIHRNLRRVTGKRVLWMVGGQTCHYASEDYKRDAVADAFFSEIIVQPKQNH